MFEKKALPIWYARAWLQVSHLLKRTARLVEQSPGVIQHKGHRWPNEGGTAPSKWLRDETKTCDSPKAASTVM
jgi:hypothetical protein